MANKNSFVRYMMGFMILQLVGFFLVADTTPTKKKRRSSRPSASSGYKNVSSWTLFRRIVSSCKFNAGPVEEPQSATHVSSKSNSQKIGCSGSICNLRDVVHGNTRVMHKGETSPENSSIQSNRLCSQESGTVLDNGRIPSSVHGSSRSLASPRPHYTVLPESTHGSFRGMHLRRWSGCYECHMIVDPIEAFSRESFRTVCACPSCGEIFTKAEALEQHETIKHAVSELSQEDSARNVVEIIFQSSWLKKENPICKIERILKVHNSQKTINKFEEYRDIVKSKANKLPKKHARCIADGNELLRFHCSTFACSLGLNRSSNLCTLPCCNICNVIKNGFSCSKSETSVGAIKGGGVYTTASSGRAHDSVELSEEEMALKGKRAMLVCRVIAGRVHKASMNINQMDAEEFVAGGFDSVAGQAGLYSNLDELLVFNPKAVLPCFVVIYRSTLDG